MSDEPGLAGVPASRDCQRPGHFLRLQGGHLVRRRHTVSQSRQGCGRHGNQPTHDEDEDDDDDVKLNIKMRALEHFGLALKGKEMGVNSKWAESTTVHITQCLRVIFGRD